MHRELSMSTVILGLALAMTAPAVSNNQTPTVTPIRPGGAPFTVSIEQVQWTGDPLPAIHSSATAVFEDKLILVGGKTAGRHGFTCNAMNNFPPAGFNNEVIVIDLTEGTVYARSVGGAGSTLDTTQQAAMSATNPLSVQDGPRLLVAGGFGHDSSASGSGFTTFDTLRVIDVPATIAWAMGGESDLADHVVFVEAPAEAPGSLATDFFMLTGGEMIRKIGKSGIEYWLCLGQSFNQGYGCGATFPDQTYSQQIRRFSIDLDAAAPVATFIGATPQESWARRRDLNIFPARVPGGLGAVAGGGPFTPGAAAGIWTVPIVLAPDGSMSMDDPTLDATLKQGFNIYNAASLAMWSESRGENWLTVLGGIGYQIVSGGSLTTNGGLPYSNDASAIRYSPSEGGWSEHLLLASYPEILSPSTGNRYYFGTETATFPLVETDEHGMYDLDQILAAPEPVQVALLFGGIVCDGQGLGPIPDTYGSNVMFMVRVGRSCIGDLDGSGSVDGHDITSMLAAWGRVAKNAIQPADLDGNGTVDAADLSTLLSNWGGCP